MRASWIAAFLALVSVISDQAKAGVSDELVFCSKIVGGRERIACYDAVARIAARPAGTPQVSPPKVTMAPVASTDRPPAVVVTASTPFHGPYLALGGSYGLSAPHSFFVFDSISTLSGTVSPEGPSAVGAVGMNLQWGTTVVGLELSGRYGSERISKSSVASSTLGFPFVPSGTSTKTYEFNVDAGARLALRAGFAINDTMIFGKIGAGVAHIHQKATSLITGTRCTLFGFGPGGFICLAQQPFTTSNSDTVNRWVPSLVTGVGLEHNFGIFFARIEGEAEAMRGPISLNEFYWTVRAMASLGVRF